MGFNIAVDGPAGAGKSTIAKLVAKKMNLIYVDTGAMYRAIALYLLRMGVDINDDEAVIKECVNADITIKYEDGVQVVYLNGENVNAFLRTEDVGNAASKTSVLAPLRAHLLSLQQNMAKSSDCIMDGRDIGTAVFPNAELKLFMTAAINVRAERRFKELQAKGAKETFEEVLKNLEERDYIDEHRETAPLAKAEDAILLDNSYMTMEEQCAWLGGILKEKFDIDF